MNSLSRPFAEQGGVGRAYNCLKINDKVWRGWWIHRQNVSGSVKMKVTNALLGTGLLLMGAGLTPAGADTFRPERGVRCDDVAQICYDRGSPSVDLTRRYFGRDAARSLRDDLRQGEGGRYERIFSPEPGVRCDRVARICHNRRGDPSVRLTRDYLGSDAARRLERQGPPPTRDYSSEPNPPAYGAPEGRRPPPERDPNPPVYGAPEGRRPPLERDPNSPANVGPDGRRLPPERNPNSLPEGAPEGRRPPPGT